MCIIKKSIYLIIPIVLLSIISHCVKREHSNPIDPKYMVPGSGPVAPSLSIPLNGSAIRDNTPFFDWSEVDRAGSYELFVTDSSGFMVLQQNTLMVTYYTASAPLPDRKYFWKVRSRDGVGNWGGWSSTWTFTIDTHGPVAPSLSMPVNDATISSDTLSFDWSDVSDAVKYDLVVVHFGGLQVIQDSSSTRSGYRATSAFSDGKYSWKVRCRDSAGNWGEWSATWSFTIKSAIVALPDPLAFGTVPLGQSKDLNLSISNPSNEVLNVTNITSTNSQFSVTSGTSFSVTAGSSQNVTVRFTPSSEGSQSGTLSISNNSSVNPKTVSLSGTGTIGTGTIGTVTDIDGNIYQTIKIGNQWWMAENLKVTHYRNGNAISNVTSDAVWLEKPSAYCDYDNNPSNSSTYGHLYNWTAVNDSRNIAPSGWHIPSDTEWQILVDYLGGDAIAGGKIKETGTAHWNSPNAGATNESGFSALPGGYRSVEGGEYHNIGDIGYFWSSTEQDGSKAWSRFPRNIDSGLSRYGSSKWDGFSIRCVKD